MLARSWCARDTRSTDDTNDGSSFLATRLLILVATRSTCASPPTTVFVAHTVASDPLGRPDHTTQPRLGCLVARQCPGPFVLAHPSQILHSRIVSTLRGCQNGSVLSLIKGTSTVARLWPPNRGSCSSARDTHTQSEHENGIQYEINKGSRQTSKQGNLGVTIATKAPSTTTIHNTADAAHRRVPRYELAGWNQGDVAGTPIVAKHQ